MQSTASLFDLTGKVVIVTGSTKGIGRAMAEGLAPAGASVVVSSRKQDLCDQVAAEIAATTGADVLGARVPRRRLGRDPRRSSTPCIERFGRIDVLVNNAGINPARVRPARHDARLLAQGVLGEPRGPAAHEPVRRSRSCATTAAAASSTSAPWLRTPAAPACAPTARRRPRSLNLTKSMATEWAQWNVRVNVLSPGPFMSEMMEGGERNAPGFHDLVAGGTFMNRIADPTEIVGPVCYLASDASSFVTGDDISVSGGMFK